MLFSFEGKVSSFERLIVCNFIFTIFQMGILDDVTAAFTLDFLIGDSILEAYRRH